MGMDKEHIAIERLQKASKMSLEKYGEPLIVTDSGGKDSSVCKALAERAGIQFKVVHGHTTVDAPETVYFIREESKRLENKGIEFEIKYPYYKGKRTSMWSLIPEMGFPPNRFQRYCCSILKEYVGKNKFIATGVRWAESEKRKNNRGVYEVKKGVIFNDDNDETRKQFEQCVLNGGRTVNPIIDWSDEDVWDYINSEKIITNPLYMCGNKRIGCVGCPLASKKERYRQFNKWPKYKENYIKAFERMLEKRKSKGKIDEIWTDGNKVFNWWMGEDVNQYTLDDFGNIE